jgi:hypothetical protein
MEGIGYGIIGLGILFWLFMVLGKRLTPYEGLAWVQRKFVSPESDLLLSLPSFLLGNPEEGLREIAQALTPAWKEETKRSHPADLNAFVWGKIFSGQQADVPRAVACEFAAVTSRVFNLFAHLPTIPVGIGFLFLGLWPISIFCFVLWFVKNKIAIRWQVLIFYRSITRLIAKELQSAST